MNLKNKILPSLILFLCSLHVFAEPMNQSVVKVMTLHQQYSYGRPWQRSQYGGTATGFVIEGQRIITNAHAAQNAVYIELSLPGHDKRYLARVVHVDHDCDLATLEVIKDANAFFAMTKPVTLAAKNPKLQESVRVIGFPKGGEELSLTRGIVSRIDMVEVANSGLQMLTVQVDAAINPGNSGGPAVNDVGEVVGVAFQGYTDAQSIGYIIPNSVLRHYLTDLEKGKYAGFPSLGLGFQLIRNLALKTQFKINSNLTGVRVAKIAPLSSAAGILEIDDVVLNINGHKIGEDGKIATDDGMRLPIQYLVQKDFIGQTQVWEVIRGGQPLTLEIPLRTRHQDIALVADRREETPSYYIYGGLVFQPLLIGYLKSWGERWFEKADNNLLNKLFTGEKLSPTHELVVLNTVLPDALNQGYHGIGELIVKNVQGQEVHNLRDVIRLVEESDSDLVRFEFQNLVQIVLDRREVAASASGLLQRFGIPADRHLN